jgi:endonuclease YncB( thermonuclease family)
METFIPYCYYATLVKVVDGDTLTLNIDCGFKHSWKVNTRLAHINTPELRSSDPVLKVKAQEAKTYLQERLPVGSVLSIISKNLTTTEDRLPLSFSMVLISIRN